VIRYHYNQQVSPPAPFVHVALGRPLSEPVISDQPAQLDTAADLSAIPLSLAEELGLIPFDTIPVRAFGGARANVTTLLVNVSLRGYAPLAIEVIGTRDEPHILLGRDLLNQLRFVLDGPRLMLEID
jgi:predicted aspartyl protease